MGRLTFNSLRMLLLINIPVYKSESNGMSSGMKKCTVYLYSDVYHSKFASLSKYGH